MEDYQLFFAPSVPATRTERKIPDETSFIAQPTERDGIELLQVYTNAIFKLSPTLLRE